MGSWGQFFRVAKKSRMMISFLAKAIQLTESIEDK
jgi:hypothetical protein